MKKLIVDINNGIMLVDSFEGYEGLEIVDEEFFVSQLDTMSDDDFYGAEVSEETYRRLKDEYGIIDRTI